MTSNKAFKHTLSLPFTNFPMRAELSTKEELILKYWQKIQPLHNAVIPNKEKFVLHDGPPYANGHIHIGTALNKILKDIINRYQRMQGKNVIYIPGWDCHGLPIEWSVEKIYLESGKKKSQISASEFREKCSEFAQNWVDIQKQEFQRLGVSADWENAYLTMHQQSEVQIVAEIHKFLMNGSLYLGNRVVMWSIAEETSLAEAEIEYKNITSGSIYLAFPIIAGNSELVGKNAKIVIWTTTPWTIPGNRAIGFNNNIKYGLYNSHFGYLIIAKSLAMQCASIFNTTLDFIDDIEINNLICKHPMSYLGQGYEFNVPVLGGEFVTDDIGTGFVHIAPSHGEDDFNLAKQYDIDIPDMINESGYYYDHVGVVHNKHIFDYQNTLIDLLKTTDLVLGQQSIVHSYPHSWRSKQKVVFRNTKQWFISMETTGLRQIALNNLNNNVKFYPSSGKNRIYSMVESRPDWLISRQRNWGVPIAIFINKYSNQPLQDYEVNAKICKTIGELGINSWFDLDNNFFLEDKYNAEDYNKVTDIVDVWFESGATHAFVLKNRDTLHFPADLYLEGSDQHRGWFQSSLLESCGTNNIAPYKAILTHGFVLDNKGYKMSKSIGNTISPQDIIDQYGADILRLWVVSSDFTEDVRIGENIIQTQVDAYRRIRNTFRYILSNINDFTETDFVDYEVMPTLEKWILHKVAVLHKKITENCNKYDLHSIYLDLYNFCNHTLSSFYFDIRKFCLYCDAKNSLSRTSCLTVLSILSDFLFKWYAPILAFTTEEAWLYKIGKFAQNQSWDNLINNDSIDSIHLEQFTPIHSKWENNELNKKMERIFLIRNVINLAIERSINEGLVRNKLDLFLNIYLNIDDKEVIGIVNLTELAMVSQVEVFYDQTNIPLNAVKIDNIDHVHVVASLAVGSKCERCLIISKTNNNLCASCNDIIKLC